MPTPLRVLILEDNPADAELVLHELRRADFEPEWVRVETEGDFLAQLDTAPDIILADYSLPQFTALEAIHILKEQEERRGFSIPFIVVTGTVSEEAAVDCMKQGAADYLLKDRLSRLGQAVLRALAEKHAQEERRRAEQALRSSEERFRRLAENAQDVIYRFRILPSRGVDYVSPSVQHITGYTPEEYYADPLLLDRTVLPDDLPPFQESRSSPESLRIRSLIRFVAKDGRILWMENRSAPVFDDAGRFVAIEGIARDITEQKLAEERTRQTSLLLQSILNASPLAIMVIDDQKRIQMWNPGAEHLFGWSSQEVMDKPVPFVPASRTGEFEHLFAEVMQGASWVGLELTRQRKDGAPVEVALWTAPLFDEENRVSAIVAAYADIAQRKAAEQELRQVTASLMAVIDASPVAIIASDQDYNVVRWNPAAERIFGWTAQEVLGGPNPVVPDAFRAEYADIRARVLAGEALTGIETQRQRKDGSLVDVRMSTAPVRDSEGALMGGLAMIEDISQRKQAEQERTLQLERMAALHEIDAAISSTMDLKLVLNVLLEQTQKTLQVDAADILLFSANEMTLEHAANRGFQSRAVEQTRLRLGVGYAGRATLERKRTLVPNIQTADPPFEPRQVLAEEPFTGYCGVPLISKGQIKGILEVFSRVPMNPEVGWLDFLDTLAGQATIAIDNFTLFTDMQRSNIDLFLAYDATLEGWSRALELRDYETEGHCKRVTEMSDRLGKLMGLAGADLTTLRRGALLHDIGKMAIPDNILRKPGPLTEGEWVIMRKHPEYAYELLSPISYLGPAVEIAYCHHEKWDGTGYPRKLRGEQIPIGARIFAVTDIADALSSDRPYRAAWPEQQVREYIHSLSGTHLDPHVVDSFERIG